MKHQSIDNFMQQRLEVCVNSEFERAHWQHVMDASKELSEVQGLDIEISQTVAMLHDSGRTIGNVHGKGHAKAGAVLAERLLKERGWRQTKRKIVCQAIQRHSQKNKIHDSYDELIKNADTLAHEIEGLIEDTDVYETTRLKVLKEKPWAYDEAPLEVVLIVFKQEWETMTNIIHSEAMFHEDSSDWVHTVRIQARKLLVLMGYLENQGSGMSFKVFKKAIRAVNKALEYPRLVYVLKKMTSKSESAYPYLVDACLKAEREAFRELSLKTSDLLVSRLYDLKLKGNCEKSFKSVQTSQKLPPSSQSVFKSFYKSLLEVNEKSPQSLHKLRLKGKKLKYLKELNICYTSSEYSYTLIGVLHHALGQYQDVIGLETLIEKEPSFNSEQLKTELKRQTEKSLRIFKETQFALQLMYLQEQQCSKRNVSR